MEGGRVMLEAQPQTASAYATIQNPVEKRQAIRSQANQRYTQVSDQEPTRVITVRMPKSLHESLRVEAHERHTSMNKLCISKLLQMIDTQLVPHEV